MQQLALPSSIAHGIPSALESMGLVSSYAEAVRWKSGSDFYAFPASTYGVPHKYLLEPCFHLKSPWIATVYAEKRMDRRCLKLLY